jgi:hypothetical protein
MTASAREAGRPVGSRQAFSAGTAAMTATVFFLLAGGHAERHPAGYAVALLQRR